MTTNGRDRVPTYDRSKISYCCTPSAQLEAQQVANTRQAWSASAHYHTPDPCCNAFLFATLVVRRLLGIAPHQLDEAESWYREALRLSRLDERDSALTNLALLMRADGDRLEEAVDLIIRWGYVCNYVTKNRGGIICCAPAASKKPNASSTKAIHLPVDMSGA